MSRDEGNAGAPKEDVMTSDVRADTAENAISAERRCDGERALDAATTAPTIASIKGELRALATRDPIDALATVVLGGSYLFYLAEKGKNPKVTSYYDALLF